MRVLNVPAVKYTISSFFFTSPAVKGRSNEVLLLQSGLQKTGMTEEHKHAGWTTLFN